MSPFTMEYSAKNTINEKLIVFNALSAAWKAQFDDPPSIPLYFKVNERNQLTLDGIVICDNSAVRAADTAYDCEYLFLSTHHPDQFYRIKIVWTFDDEIFIDEVALVLYQAGTK